MRLNRFIASCGVCSRREADRLIQAGRVEVNGQKMLQFSFQVKPQDAVTVDGKPVNPATFLYLAVNKPEGYTCTLKDNFARKKITELIPASFGRVFPVGRLDKNSCGLVLLTNDGYLAQKLTHPRYQVEKEYEVTVVPSFRREDITALLTGVADRGEKLVASQVSIIKNLSGKSILRIVLHQGKKRQIRRMLAVTHYHILKLKRIRIGTVSLGNLKPGQYRHLTEKEIENLRQTG